jgi:hypothetical protein
MVVLETAEGLPWELVKKLKYLKPVSDRRGADKGFPFLVFDNVKDVVELSE